MSIYSSDLRNFSDKLSFAIDTAANKRTRVAEKEVLEQRRANELKLVELILIYGAEDVKAALDQIKITDNGIEVKVTPKAAKKLDGLRK
jgi:hypothetical protein